MAITKYTKNVLFGLGYLYIQINKPYKAEHFLSALCLLDNENKEAKILLSVSQVMQGRKITVDEFNFARRYAPPAIVQMLSKRTKINPKIKQNEPR